MVKDEKEKTTTRKLMFIHREIVSRWKGKPFWFQLHSSTFMNFREMKNKPFSYSSSLFKRPFIFPSCDFIWPWFAVLRCCQSTCTPATRPLIRLLQCIYPGSSLWSFLGRSVCLRSTNAMGKYMGNQYLDTCTHTWMQAAAEVICGKYKMQHAWKSVFWFAVHLRGGQQYTRLCYWLRCDFTGQSSKFNSTLSQDTNSFKLLYYYIILSFSRQPSPLCLLCFTNYPGSALRILISISLQ